MTAAGRRCKLGIGADRLLLAGSRDPTYAAHRSSSAPPGARAPASPAGMDRHPATGTTGLKVAMKRARKRPAIPRTA